MFRLIVSSVRYIPFLTGRMYLGKHLYVSIEFSHLELVLITALIIDCLELCAFFFVYNYNIIILNHACDKLYLVSNLYRLPVYYFHSAKFL